MSNFDCAYTTMKLAYTCIPSVVRLQNTVHTYKPKEWQFTWSHRKSAVTPTIIAHSNQLFFWMRVKRTSRFMMHWKSSSDLRAKIQHVSYLIEERLIGNTRMFAHLVFRHSLWLIFIRLVRAFPYERKNVFGSMMKSYRTV